MILGAAYADGLQYQRCVNINRPFYLFCNETNIVFFSHFPSPQIDLWKYSFVLRIRKDTLLHNEASFAAHAIVNYLKFISLIN